jgi:hypothetical protein
LVLTARAAHYCGRTALSVTSALLRAQFMEGSMAGCDGLTFKGLKRNGWNAIKRAAASYGLSGGDAGQASSQGYTFAWRYDEGSMTLRIQCVDAPDMIPCSQINARLRAELGQVVADAGENFDETMIA